jgi:hypothetical protein
MLAASRPLRTMDLPALKLNAAQWSRAEADGYRILIEQLQQRVGRTGIPARHPFWGSNLLALVPTDLDDVARATRASIQAAGALSAAVTAIATACGVDIPASGAEAALLLESARVAASAPDLNDLDTAHRDWLLREDEIARVLTAGRKQRDLQRKYKEVLRQDSWERDVTTTRRDVAEVGFRWWRFLSPRWRRVRGEVQSLCSRPAPGDASGMLSLLDAVLDNSSSARAVREAQSWIASMFGSNWRGLSSEWELLERQAAWILDARRRIQSGGVGPWCIDTRVRTINRSRLALLAGEAKAAGERFSAAVEAWRSSLKIEAPNGFGLDQPWTTLRMICEVQLANLGRLHEMVAFNQIAAECRKRGLSEVVDVACEWEHAPGHLVHLFERCRLAYPSVRYCRTLNLRALSEIACAGSVCTSGPFSTDWELDGRMYVFDNETRFVLDTATPGEDASAGFAKLSFADTSFLARFRQPTSYRTLDGEVWRLYSRSDNKLEVFVGYAVSAPWKAIETPASLFPSVDAALMHEADKIAGSLSSPKTSVRASVDGFQVVDSATERVIEQGPWIPAFLPKGVPVPAPGLRLCRSGSNLLVAVTDRKARLSATTLAEVGDLWLIGCLCVLGSIATGAAGHTLAKWLPPPPLRTASIENALHDGESQNVEFKRDLSDNESRVGETETEVLRSVIAFANTNDGVIFLGIDDNRHPKGLRVDDKGRDRLEQKVRELIKNRVKPIPPVEIKFEELHGMVIARIAVACGGEPPYMMSGVIYVRRGSSDVQAQPEDVRRLMSA